MVLQATSWYTSTESLTIALATETSRLSMPAPLSWVLVPARHDYPVHETSLRMLNSVAQACLHECCEECVLAAQRAGAVLVFSSKLHALRLIDTAAAV